MLSSDATGKVTYFEIWAEEAEERRFLAHALEILRSAVADCSEQDVRTDELGQALAFVERHLVRPALVRRFHKALDVPDPMERAAATRQAYEAIDRAV